MKKLRAVGLSAKAPPQNSLAGYPIYRELVKAPAAGASSHGPFVPFTINAEDSTDGRVQTAINPRGLNPKPALTTK
jgi:hypothetical protein